MGIQAQGVQRRVESSNPQRGGAMGQAPMWAQGVWPQQQQLWGPPPIQASFDGTADRVALFLSQIITHMDLYGHLYPSQWAMVVAITMVLTGEVADWVADFHSDHTKELANMGMFLEAMRGHFEDIT